MLWSPEKQPALRHAPRIDPWLSVPMVPSVVAERPGTGLRVAVQDGLCRIATSINGGPWFGRSVPMRSWSTIVWNNNLREFVAASRDGAVMTSPDGITWSVQHTGVRIEVLNFDAELDQYTFLTVDGEHGTCTRWA